MDNFSEKVTFIWSVADLLRGDYKQSEYGRVILPLTVLRRLDCVLEPTKEAVLKKLAELKKTKILRHDELLVRVSKYKFFNTSKYTFAKMKDDPAAIAANLENYIAGFSENTREMLERFRFEEQIARLDKANLLYQVLCKFAEIDLHPEVVSNQEMGYIYEELVRKFSEMSNETAGEHFTPREVIRLMVNVLFMEDKKILRTKGIVKTLYDPACGTGGMLSVAEDYLRELNPDARLESFGQELNDETYAVCKSDMLIKGQNPANIKYGNSFSEDQMPGDKFNYMLSNPPFGVEWKKVQDKVRKEHESLGHAGRFGAGLPRISDGSLLFLQHMLSKMKQDDDGTRIAIIFNASPLFSGEAGSGESEIRRWIIENDWLEAIIALPDQLFYNTGIFTYIWVLANRKARKRKGKIQLVNAVEYRAKMRKSLGNKRNELSADHIAQITRLYGDFQDGEEVRIFNGADFGYRRIVVERPLRLNFQATSERIDLLKETKPWQDLAASKKKGKAGEKEAEEGRALQAKIQKAIVTACGGKTFQNRAAFLAALDVALENADLKLAAPLRKAITGALGERDETAEICTDADGAPEPDAELRDFENVPLVEDIHVYFEREVRPHVPDAWIDESKTRIGYEIPFTRHFYKYKPLRPLEVIDAEVKALEQEIQAMLAEVTS